jgi:hypothetical protein
VRVGAIAGPVAGEDGPAADGVGEGLAPMSPQPMFPGRSPDFPLGVVQGTKSDNEGTTPTAEAEDVDEDLLLSWTIKTARWTALSSSLVAINLIRAHSDTASATIARKAIDTT